MLSNTAIIPTIYEQKHSNSLSATEKTNPMVVALLRTHLLEENKANTRQFSWFLDFYLSLHFVKMFEYIKSYLKMSNWPDIKFHFFFKNHLV